MSLVEVRMVFSIGAAAERIATCKWDFETAATPTGSDLLAMATAAKDAWNTTTTGGKNFVPASTDLARVEAFTWQAVQVTDAELVRYPRCVGMLTNPYKRVQISTPEINETDVGGVGAGSALPPNVAVCASFRTALAGRHHRGRIYLPPIAEGDVDASGAILEATRAGLETACDLVAQGVEGSVLGLDIDHVVWTHCENTTEEVSDIRVNQRVDTQRRRLGA